MKAFWIYAKTVFAGCLIAAFFLIVLFLSIDIDNSVSVALVGTQSSYVNYESKKNTIEISLFSSKMLVDISPIADIVTFLRRLPEIIKTALFASNDLPRLVVIGLVEKYAGL